MPSHACKWDIIFIQKLHNGGCNFLSSDPIQLNESQKLFPYSFLVIHKPDAKCQMFLIMASDFICQYRVEGSFLDLIDIALSLINCQDCDDTSAGAAEH